MAGSAGDVVVAVVVTRSRVRSPMAEEEEKGAPADDDDDEATPEPPCDNTPADQMELFA